jgi:hypothetical protein
MVRHGPARLACLLYFLFITLMLRIVSQFLFDVTGMHCILTISVGASRSYHEQVGGNELLQMWVSPSTTSCWS